MSILYLFVSIVLKYDLVIRLDHVGID